MPTDPASLGEAGTAFADALEPGADERGVIEDELRQLAPVLPAVDAWGVLGHGEEATLVLLSGDLLLTISREPAPDGSPRLVVAGHPLRIIEASYRHHDRRTLWEFQFHHRDPLRIEGRTDTETADQAESLARALAASIGWRIGEPPPVAAAEPHADDAAGPGSPPQADAGRQRITDIWGNPASARKRRRP